MTSAEFRERGRQVIDWIADYLETVEHRPVLSPATPGSILEQLPQSPPERGEAWSVVMGDLDRIILPGITHWQSPSFFGFFPANTSGPAILGELLSAGLGVQGMLWATSPACTELETRVLDWLAQMIDLPSGFRSQGLGEVGAVGGGGGSEGGGVIQSTASDGTLVALVAARHRALQRDPGLEPDAMTMYTSTQAHSSVIKAAMVAGLAKGPDDRTQVRLIETDAGYAMRPDLLEAALSTDRASGKMPIFVCATVGTTGTTAIDPLDKIGPVCQAHGAWLHVDAAFSGAACVCPEHRWTIRGVEHAQSFSFNPHKWLLTNFDCSCFWTTDRRSLTGALSITPEYLRNAASQSGGVIDYRDWQVPLGRRFRALKLWMVIRHYGVEGLRAYIREHVRLGEVFEALVRGDDRFEIVAPRTSSLVCFAPRQRGDESIESCNLRAKALLESVNATGRVYLTHTVLPRFAMSTEAGVVPRVLPGPGRFTLRLAIGSTRTTEREVRSAWALLAQQIGTDGQGHGPGGMLKA